MGGRGEEPTDSVQSSPKQRHSDAWVRYTRPRFSRGVQDIHPTMPKNLQRRESTPA